MLWAACASFVSTTWSAERAIRVLAYEPFRPITDTPSASQAKPDTGSIRRLKFDAFGRRFALSLEKNTRLSALSEITDTGPALTLYRGSLENIPGSWVRLSAQAQAIRGLIWDGTELYIVDSVAAAAGDPVSSGSPGTAADSTSDSIIFRLADTHIEPGALFCGASAATGKAAYAALLQELKGSPVIMRAMGASLRLELSLIGDASFRERYTSDQQALDAILTRINNVDGIYTAQLGVELQATTVNLNDAIAARISSSTDSNALVDDLSTLRSQTPALRAGGLTHLFTGRDLDGATVGVAFTGGLCSPRYGAGLTQVSGSSGIDSLITAHEMGHNFGASHDGEGQCASTPVGQYIMSPSVNQGATTFSQCSLDAILPRLQDASCLLPMSAPDLSVDADLGTRTAAVSTALQWPLTITNGGGSTARNSQVTIFVPPAVGVDDAWVAGGTCTSGAGIISCDMGDIAAAGTRVVQLTLHSDVLGSNSIAAHVNTLTDSRSSNDSGDGTLIIAPQIDLAVSVATPSTLEVGSSATLSFTTQNLSSIDAAEVNIDLILGNGLRATAAQFDAGSCTVAGDSAHCTLASLSAGASAGGSITYTASMAGTGTVQAQVSGAFVDPNMPNNLAERSVVIVQPAAVQTAPTRRSGGGGPVNLSLLLGLASLLCLRRLRIS